MFLSEVGFGVLSEEEEEEEEEEEAAYRPELWRMSWLEIKREAVTNLIRRVRGQESNPSRSKRVSKERGRLSSLIKREGGGGMKYAGFLREGEGGRAAATRLTLNSAKMSRDSRNSATT
ncbi:hypothetical protein KOW79_000158 [Hemibagrus wyckioides]|uniref:Uncharacterized protein n=1 Tax=Hemibagrus wyckioides TaxID=337641 RepID=A0A9D3SUI2_9TELE|nr:hypothetical protein KOW79_000158 [Hemibagrus wyckioides]